MRSDSEKHLRRRRDDQKKWDTKGMLIAPSADAPIELAEIFGNSRPVELEIGTGKGTFLLARASARPEVNFLGIEWARAYALYSADRFRRHSLENVRMIHGDATQIIRQLADSSLFRVHIYFPDPWPKRRHHHRRSIQPAFLDELRRVICPGGQLIIVTDHLGYFRHIQRVLLDAEGFACVPMPQMADADGEIVGTNFERKYIAQGRPFYSVALLRYV